MMGGKVQMQVHYDGNILESQLDLVFKRNEFH